MKKITMALIERTTDKETLENILLKLVNAGWDNNQKYNKGNKTPDSFHIVLKKMDVVLEKLNNLTQDTWEYRDFNNSGREYFQWL